MKHTLESIAKLAGVSRGTVSRYINNQPGVRPQVQKTLQRIIEETGYIPHPHARSLAGGKTGNIGVIVFGTQANFLTHHIFYEVLQGIQLAAEIDDYDLLLFANRSGSDEEYWKRVAARRKVDGLIIMGERIREPYLQYYREQQIPFVLVGKRDFDSLPLQCVTSDYHSGAHEAAQYLLRSGRDKIVYIYGIPDIYPEQQKFNGFKQVLEKAGLKIDPNCILYGNADQAEARRQMDQFMNGNHHFDAVFAANDLMAFGAIESLAERGKRVPQDVVVVGYDDIQAATMFQPSLTTVRQDKLKLGREAYGLLLKLMSGEISSETAVDVVLSNELIVREST